MSRKECPHCGEYYFGQNSICDECSKWIDHVEQRWCPLCGHATEDTSCPACEHEFEEAIA